MLAASIGLVVLFTHPLVVDTIPEADRFTIGVGLDAVSRLNLGCFEVISFVVCLTNLLLLSRTWLKLITLDVKMLKAIGGLRFQDDIAVCGILKREHGLGSTN